LAAEPDRWLPSAERIDRQQSAHVSSWRGAINFLSLGVLPFKRCEANIFLDDQRRHGRMPRAVDTNGRATSGVPIEARP